eukprot:m.8128 g.8128  ORF g.8128 m.8128 type:complete len:74 (+) comp3142_c0_seq1:72-293(+)
MHAPHLLRVEAFGSQILACQMVLQVDALKTASLPLEVTVPVTTVSATESTVTFDIEGYSIAHIAFPSRTTVAK